MSDRKIIKYQTVYVNEDEDIDKRVNEEIRCGWQPLGGISMMFVEESQCNIYCQAMVKYESL
jgi:hypothetical protein